MTKNYNWWQEGVIYQIYPRSFYDSTQNGIGDLQGITQKLDYLEELGVDAIWLSPIYPSPDIDFGYDISDYRAIDPKFGTMDDFEYLLENAHQKGIKVILDLVINHTSDQHPWFLESRSSRDNEFRDWYIWKNPAPNHRPPNNWQSIFGGKAWHFDEITGQYYYHMFYKEQPDLNWRNPRVYSEMLDIIKFWCDKGVDGFRLDVFNAFFKNKDFPDNPLSFGLRGFDRQKHIYDVDQPELVPLLNDIRRLLDSYPVRYAVGETFLESPGKAEKYCGSDLLHGTFNFNLAKTPWNAKKLLRQVLSRENSLKEDAWPTQVLNNHDLSRSASRFGRGENDERLKIAAGLLLTLRGTPYLYYGEEIGMRNISTRRNEILDPVGKKYWPFFKGRDGCRSPMQWNSSLYSGFSSTKPWLPVHKNYPVRNLEYQRNQPDSLLNFYKRLLKLRKAHSALRKGSIKFLHSQDQRVVAFTRDHEEETVLIFCNFTRKKIGYDLGPLLSKNQWELLLSNCRERWVGTVNDTMSIYPEEFLMLQMISCKNLRHCA